MPAPTVRTYDVFLHAADHRDTVEAFAKQDGIPVLGRSTRKIRVEARADQAEELNALDAVALVEEYVLPTLCNDRARKVVWPQPPAELPLTGDGEIVAVADSGLDASHVAFKNRVLKTFAHGRPNETSDPHGHGTHVAATIVGESGRQRGLASGAKLVFQSLMDAQGNLKFPVDLGDLLAEAYDAGARIHNDSWGAELQAAYPMTSFEIDAFVHAKRDMLVVIAAGNAGSALAPNQGLRRTAPGFVEWGSVGAPATAKNALVVGASRSDRKQGGASAALTGVGEGHKLALTARQLKIPINQQLGGEHFIADGSQAFGFHGLNVTVVGPTKANLNALAVEWKAFIAKQMKRIQDGKLQLAAMADSSIPNLSSIQLFVKAHDKTLLLTGDGRGDHLLEGLEAAGLLDDEGGIDLDLLKVPHHGSDRNVNRDFFERVRAKTYVISADGKHGNPDLATLQWILAAQPENAQRINIVVTNNPPSVEKFARAFPPDDNGYKLLIRDPEKNFIDVTLAE